MKSDVYSFGVVMLELLCGRPPIDNTLENKSEWYNDKVRTSLQAGDIDSILDPAVRRCQPNMDSVWKMAEIAIQSVKPKRLHRPSMDIVVEELRKSYSAGARPLRDLCRPIPTGIDCVELLHYFLDASWRADTKRKAKKHASILIYQITR